MINVLAVEYRSFFFAGLDYKCEIFVYPSQPILAVLHAVNRKVPLFNLKENCNSY